MRGVDLEAYASSPSLSYGEGPGSGGTRPPRNTLSNCCIVETELYQTSGLHKRGRFRPYVVSARPTISLSFSSWTSYCDAEIGITDPSSCLTPYSHPGSG